MDVILPINSDNLLKLVSSLDSAFPACPDCCCAFCFGTGLEQLASSDSTFLISLNKD